LGLKGRNIIRPSGRETAEQVRPGFLVFESRGVGEQVGIKALLVLQTPGAQLKKEKAQA
jgi:hypothetical protein